MRILLCHNFYQQPGGEDQSFADEARLLESRGHEVVTFSLHNDSIHHMSRLEVARRTIWNQQSYRDLRAAIRTHRPSVVHCTNTFPLISPAAYYAARAEGVCVVQALRNYRLLCPNALFLRDGRPCEDCLGKAVAWPAVLHGCYRQDRAATATVTAMVGMHRAIRTWSKAVSLYFTLTEFARQKFIAGGFPPGQIVVKPNFVNPDPGPGPGGGGYMVFAGRLSVEKGIDVLLDAWARLGRVVPLKIIGDGPLAPQVEAASRTLPGIEWLRRRPQPEVLEIIGKADALVMPSIVYETFGRTIIEAMAKGTPVITSRRSAMAELVDEGCTGLLAEPGDADQLAATVNAMLADRVRLSAMRPAARAAFENKYTAEPNYRMLLAIYRRAMCSPGANLAQGEAAIA